MTIIKCLDIVLYVLPSIVFDTFNIDFTHKLYLFSYLEWLNVNDYYDRRSIRSPSLYLYTILINLKTYYN